MVYFEHQIRFLEEKTIEIDDVRDIFEPFGTLKTIIIYNRVGQIKVFVEYAHKIDLLLLQQFIHGKVYNDLCMVYVSKAKN